MDGKSVKSLLAAAFSLIFIVFTLNVSAQPNEHSDHKKGPEKPKFDANEVILDRKSVV